MKEEDWTKISDVTQRRRVQNRIAQRRYRKRRQEALERLIQDRCSCQKQKRASDRTPEKEKDLQGDQKGTEQLCPVLEESTDSPSAPFSNFLIMPRKSIKLEWESNLSEDYDDHGDSSLGASLVPSPRPSDTGHTKLTDSHMEMWLPDPFIQAFVKLADLEMGRNYDRLFLFNGDALTAGGPASILLSEVLTCTMFFCALDPLTEMMIYQPSGSFISFAFHYIDPAWAFTVGWIYIFHCLTIIPLDMMVAGKVMKTAVPSVSIVALLSILIMMVISTIFLKVMHFVGIATLLGLAKIIIIIGVGLFAVLTASLKGQPPTYRPFEYWTNPGAFNGRIFGAAAVLFFSGTSPSGLDIISLAAFESNPTPGELRLSMRVLIWTLTIIRVFIAVVAGITVPFTDVRLVELGPDYGVSASPLIISTVHHKGGPIVVEILRIGFVIVQLSSTLSTVFAVSRALFALAERQQAPAVFTSRDRGGRLLISLLISAGLTVFGYAALSEFSDVFLSSVVDASGVPILLIHLTIFVAHVKFRSGLRKQGRFISGTGHNHSTGRIGSYFGIIFCLTVFLCQLWTALAPSGYSQALSVELVGISLTNYTYIPVSLSLYASYKIYCRTQWTRGAEMDFSVS
ncbi:histidine permease [Cladophialophora chaetospira]|uniref:Histidine permease n=1 Tax=Cladophialophora chaetospira TaxID=386627 RepID=A0AA38U8P8_9EURO|nr:histidine permease [Cladophialophora chaetospira]